MTSGSKNINWDQQPLGQTSDHQLARTIGVSQNSVSHARRKRNIPQYKPTQDINWDNVDWSKTNNQLSHQLNISYYHIQKKRQELGK